MSYAKEDCPKIRQQLALYAGRDLEEPLCAEVEQHLAQCANCSAELAQAQTARQRIAVLGAQTSREVGSLELWPAISQRLAKERAPAADARIRSSARTAELARVDRRVLQRAWIPIFLAAAALLVIALRSSFDSDAPSVPPIVRVVNPSPVAPNLAPDLASTGTVVTEPGGVLRRADPGEERLRDLSSPLGMPLSPRLGQGRQNTPNALAGDDLR